MKRLALLLAVVLPAAALAASAGPGAKPTSSGPGDDELQKLKAEIAAAKLDRTLSVTRDQARALLPTLKEAQQLRAQIRAERDRRRPEIIRALTGVRDDLLKTGVVSEAGRKALQEARGEAILKQTRGKLRALHLKVRDQLTPEQRQRLRDFSPRPLEPKPEEEIDLEGSEPPGRRGHGKGPGLKRIFKIATSPEFLSLLEARAR
ncbi:MAG: hypothetical protein HY901_10300 [Deltaproteobacteria bacterium]|nr:hypothetical protein [Deltaproteobacteria bacterium]